MIFPEGAEIADPLNSKPQSVDPTVSVNNEQENLKGNSNSNLICLPHVGIL